MPRKWRPPPKRGMPIPAAPFVAWVNAQPGTREELAGVLGVNEKTVRRWSGSQDGESRPTTTYRRRSVENALARAGVPFEDVYPDLAAQDDVVLEPDAWCGRCVEMVTPIEGVCPWCETHVANPVAVAA